MRREDSSCEGFYLKNKANLRVSFVQSSLIISGVATKEGKGIVASFKLEAKGGGSPSQKDPEYYDVELKIVFKPEGNELCTIFSDSLAKYDESKYTIVKNGYCFSCWRTSYSDAKKAIGEAKEALKPVAS